MITRRQSRLLSANSGASNNQITTATTTTTTIIINNNNNNNTSTKVDNTAAKITDIKVNKESVMKCVPEMMPDTDAQNITIPTDLFKDFENLKSATKLDSATLMRKLLTDFNKLKENDDSVPGNRTFTVNDYPDRDINTLLTTIKQECPSPETGHISPSAYPISESTITSATGLDINENLEMSRCKKTKDFQNHDSNINFINGQISSPGSQTEDDENRKRKNNTDDGKSNSSHSKFPRYLDNNNDSRIEHTSKNSPYHYNEYQNRHQSLYKRNMHYQHQYLEPQEAKIVPFVCKTEDLSSYNDGYGVDITHGSKLFKSRHKEEFDRKDRGSSSEIVQPRYGDNQLGPMGPATDNSDDTETYEIPSSINTDFQSPGPLNHGERLISKKMDSENHYLTNIKAMHYGLLKDGGYGKTETAKRSESPDNEIPLDLSIVKMEPNISYSSVSRSQSSSSASPNPSFVATSSPNRTKDYSNLYTHLENHVTKPHKREPDAKEFSPEEEKENLHSFQEACSLPETNPTSSLSLGYVPAIEKPDMKPDPAHGRSSSSPEIISAGSTGPKITDVSGSFSTTKISQVQQMQVNMQQQPAVETLLSSPGQQETASKAVDVHPLVVPQINPGFLGPAGQNMTAKFIPLPTSVSTSMPVTIPTNVVAVQKNDNCMYVYPMSFPTLSSMPPNSQHLGVPQPVMPVQKLEPLSSFVPDKGPEKDQLKLVAESNIFPGVYTSILKLSSHKRSRSKQDKSKSNQAVNHAQSTAPPPPPPPPPNVATQVSALTSQPMTSQAVMFIPTMRPLQNVCVPTTAVGQSVQPQPNFPLTSSPATATPITNSHVSVPSKQTVTMTSAGVANTHTSSSTGQQSIIMVYPHTAISALGKPVRRRGRPPKLPMLTQLLVDKRPKIANVPITENKSLTVLDQKDLPLVSPAPFQERVNVTKPEPIPIDINESADDKLDGVEILGETPATVTSQVARTKKIPVSLNSSVPTVASTLTTNSSSSSSSSGGPLYQEMILSPRSLKNIKPRKPHSANDFMKPNANFICTSFRIRPRAFRSRRNGNGRNRKNAKGSLQPQSPMMATASPQLQHQITQQQLQMHQEQLQKQLQQQIQQQQQQEQQRQEEKVRQQEEQQQQQKLLLQQQQQQLQQQLQQQQQQQQQLQQQLQQQQLQEQQLQQQQQQQQQLQQQQQQQQQEEEELQQKQEQERHEETEIYSLPSSPTDLLKGSISPLPSSTSLHHRLENNKSWTSDDNSRGSSPRNFFQELYHCKICNEIVSSEEKASHQREHIPIRFFCQTCGLEYQSFLARNPTGDKSDPNDDDIPEDNNGEPIELPEPLQCDRCCENFSHPKFALNRCLQVQGGNILCDLCGDQFRTFTNFYEHRNKVHGDCGLSRAEHYVCETCGKILYTSKALRLHRKLHLDRTVQCTINDCPRFFHNNMDLLRHIREQHDKTKEFSCIYDGCNKKFMKNFHLQEHIRVKHFNIRAFHCSWPGCTKEFAAERHLKVHLLIHKDEKPLKCEFCDYRCRQRNALNWHMRKHPEAPYKYRKFSINSSDC